MATTATPIHVEIWSDVVCPWCYIGKRRFERALEKLAGEVQVDYVFRAFQLDPTASMGKSQPVVDAYAKKFGGPERAQAIIDRVTSIAAEEGLEFRLDRALAGQHAARPPPVLARRAAGLAGASRQRSRSGCCRPTSTTVSTSVIPDVLATCAAELGFDRDTVITFLDSEAGVREVARRDRAGERPRHHRRCPPSWSTARGRYRARRTPTRSSTSSASCGTASSSSRRRSAKTTSAMSERRLVFLHGFTQTHHHWHRLRTAHRASSLGDDPTLLFVDLPGHGLSAADRLTIEQAAPQLVTLAGRGTYIGYSMGARHALAAACAGVPEIERLVLVGGTAGLADPAERDARVADDEAKARHLEQIGVDAFVDEWLAQPMFAGLAVRRRATDGVTACATRSKGWRRACVSPGPARRSRCGTRSREVQIPVLVLAGERDGKFTEIGRRMTSALPNATFAAIPNAGHAAHAGTTGGDGGVDRRLVGDLTEREAERQQRAVGELHPSRSRRAPRSGHGRRHPTARAERARRPPRLPAPPAPTRAGRGHRRRASTSAPATRATYNQRVASVADPHRQRALARCRVGRDVAQVVDDQQRAGEEADTARRRPRDPRHVFDRDVCRADGGDEPEEREHEQLAETEIAVRLRVRRCSPTRRGSRRRPTSSSHHDVVAASASPASAASPRQPSAARLTADGDAVPDATSRIGPTRTSSVPRTPSL